MATDNPILNTAAASAGAATDPNARLNAVQEAITANTAKSVSNIATLEQGAKESSMATNTITSSIKDMTSSAQLIKTVTDTASMQAQNATIAAYAGAGGIGSQTALMRQLATDSDRVQKLLDQKQATVNETHTGIQLIDGIINQFASFNTDLQIEAAQAQRNQTINDIGAITNATQSIESAQLSTRKLITDATIAANYKQIAAEGAIKGAQADINNIQTNATATARVMQANQNLTDNLISAYRIEGEAQSRAAQAAQLEFDKERMVVMRKQWEDGAASREVQLERARLDLATAKATNPTAIPAAIARNEAAVKANEDNLALEAQITRAGQAGQALSGLPIEEPQMIIRGLQSSNPSTRAKYEKLLDLGSSSRPVMGNTPAEAYINYNEVNPSGTLPQTRANTALKAIEKMQLDSYTSGAKPQPKDKGKLQSDFNDTARSYMASKAQDIRTGDATNPYIGAPFSVLAESAAVKTSALYTKVLSVTGMKELNPEEILATTLAGMRAKIVTPEQAASGIATIFKVAANKNNTENGGYSRVGLANQTSYNVVVPVEPTMFDTLSMLTSASIRSPLLLTAGLTDLFKGDNKNRLDAMAKDIASKYQTLNLMDQSAVQLYLIKKMSSQASISTSTSTSTATATQP